MANLTLNEYQDKAMSTCMPESDNLFYMLANLVGEVGEFASKAGKHMRKGKLHITTTQRDEGGRRKSRKTCLSQVAKCNFRRRRYALVFV